MLTLTPFAGIAVAFLLAVALTPLAKRVAIRVGAVDRKVKNKIHAEDVPRLGGVAIAVAFYVPVLFLALRNNLFSESVYGDPRKIAALLGGGVVILALGAYDDLRGASAWKKLAVQVPVAVAAWMAGVRIGGTAVGAQFFHFSEAISCGVTVLWLTGVVNAINLIDGLDGLASGLAVQALGAAALCAWHRGEPALALLALCLLGAVGGFLVHNFHPASIFMGDSGSMFLGYVLGVASAWSSQKAATAVGVVMPALALGLPLLDTLAAVWRRLAAGRPVFQGDLDHIHHRLLAMGWSHRRVVLMLYGVGALFSALSVALVFDGERTLHWPLVGLALVLAIAFTRWVNWRSAAARRAAGLAAAQPRPAEVDERRAAGSR
jgi:UDP-GlcNAc:undecaprenyl-phosphate GlcNAc-1-phosphate transferase